MQEIDSVLSTANLARNEALSYYTASSGAIERLNVDLIESGQAIAGQLLRIRTSTPGYKIKVVFLVPDTSLWDVYSPLYSIMVSSDRFEPLVISFERRDVTSDKNISDVQRFFESRGITPILEGYFGVECSPLSNINPDYVFYTLGSIAYPEEYRIEFISKAYRTCYLSYGFLMVDELEYQFGQSFHQAAWAVFASTNREKLEYDARCVRKHKNAILSGYPKFDLYRTSVSFATERKIIIWAPHWTIGDVYPSLNFGTFHETHEYMKSVIKKFSDIEFYFKPHPNLKHACAEVGLFTFDEYERFVSDLESLGNVKVWVHGDYFHLFKSSSAMITDSISFLAEYLPSGKPLFFPDRLDRVTMTDEAEDILSLHYKSSDFYCVEKFIEEVVLGVDVKASIRLAAIEDLLNYDPDRVNSQCIIDVLVGGS